MTATTTELLTWNDFGSHQEAQLGTKDDGVNFCLSLHPTCHRRGPWRLLIEVCSGENHERWGCFDLQDQPLRYFHDEGNAKSEAELIAQVLHRERHGGK